MSESRGRPPRGGRRARSMPPVLLLLAFLVTALAAVAVVWLRDGPPTLRGPTPAQLLAAAREARAELAEFELVLTTPWPQANPAVSAAPGAKALLGPVEGERTWRIRWHRTMGLRAEVIAPAELAGTLTIVTPEAYWAYSPLLKVALTGPPAAPPAPYIDGLLAMAAAGRNPRLTGQGEVDGRETYEVVISLDDASNGPAAAARPLELRLSIDAATSLPLAATLSDADGRLLGTLRVSELQLAPALAQDDFAFVPPAPSTVLTLGNMRAFPSLAAAAAQLPFTPQLPLHLPAGLSLQAVNILGDAGQAALVLTYLPDPTTAEAAGAPAPTGLLSLTQTIAGPDYQPLTYGMPQQTQGWSGRQFELGELRVVDWRSGDLALTLFGTTTFAELRRVAASVLPAP